MKKKRVLVVDDELDICFTLKEFMSLKGCKVEIAYDGKQAIRKTRSFKPHTILLDIAMPVMDGIDALKKIKTIAPETNVIIVTAVCERDTIRKTLNLGACECIFKPFDLDHLESVALN